MRITRTIPRRPRILRRARRRRPLLRRRPAITTTTTTTTNQEVGRVQRVRPPIDTTRPPRFPHWLWRVRRDLGSDRSSNESTRSIEKDASRVSIGRRRSTSLSRDQNALYISA